MSSLYLVISSLFLLSILSSSQIILPALSTLIDTVQSNSANDANLGKAYISILQTHPELAYFSIFSVSTVAVNTTGTDYYITLKGSDNSTVMAVVSLEADISSFFVSYVKIDANGKQTFNTASTPAPQDTYAAAINNIQYSQATLTDISPNTQVQSDKTLLIKPLGGFRLMDNLNDAKFLIAIGYLQQRHTNLINYQLILAQYQIVAGVNFRVHYSGFDKITKVSAIINVGLNGIPSQVQFSISCLQTALLDCTSQIASQIYFGNQFVINYHPELKEYRIISIYIEQRTTTSMTFMTTFQNTQMALRAIAQLMTASKGVNVLSYYSYRYQ